MLNNTNEWSHTRGNAVVPSRWQATDLTIARPGPASGSRLIRVPTYRPRASMPSSAPNSSITRSGVKCAMTKSSSDRWPLHGEFRPCAEPSLKA
jgi:hypothetical protein